MGRTLIAVEFPRSLCKALLDFPVAYASQNFFQIPSILKMQNFFYQPYRGPPPSYYFVFLFCLPKCFLKRLVFTCHFLFFISCLLPVLFQLPCLLKTQATGLQYLAVLTFTMPPLVSWTVTSLGGTLISLSVSFSVSRRPCGFLQCLFTCCFSPGIFVGPFYHITYSAESCHSSSFNF